MNEDTLVFLDTLKDELAGLAESVYLAQKDGRITWVEGIQLATQGTVAATAIIGAFRGLSEQGIEELLDALKNSDLTFN